MRDSVMWFLITAVVLSSLITVHVRHQHRNAYTAWHAEKNRRDALNDEWGQLLIEANLWSFHHHIEKKASGKLAMRQPQAEEVVYIDLNSGSLMGQETLSKAHDHR